MQINCNSGPWVRSGGVGSLRGARPGGGGTKPQPEPSETGLATGTRPAEVVAHPFVMQAGTPSRALPHDGISIQALSLIVPLSGYRDRDHTERHALRLSVNRWSGGRS